METFWVQNCARLHKLRIRGMMVLDPRDVFSTLSATQCSSILLKVLLPVVLQDKNVENFLFAAQRNDGGLKRNSPQPGQFMPKPMRITFQSDFPYAMRTQSNYIFLALLIHTKDIHKYIWMLTLLWFPRITCGKKAYTFIL